MVKGNGWAKLAEENRWEKSSKKNSLKKINQGKWLRKMAAENLIMAKGKLVEENWRKEMATNNQPRKILRNIFYKDKKNCWRKLANN